MSFATCTLSPIFQLQDMELLCNGTSLHIKLPKHDDIRIINLPQEVEQNTIKAKIKKTKASDGIHQNQLLSKSLHVILQIKKS